MSTLNINIISTEKDMDLFLNNNYYSKVKNALDSIRKEYDLTKKHSIACYEDYIKLYNGNELVLVREF